MRTKIVATLGPATRTRGRMEALLRAGVDVVRINFSHGSYEEHEADIRNARELAHDVGRPVAILQDLCGPKIRTGTLKGGGAVNIPTGGRLTLTSEDIEGTAEETSVDYPHLSEDCRPGDMILLDDGNIQLRVVEARAGAVVTEVIDGGILTSGKGVNFPGARLRVPAMTAKDEADLRFGIEHGVDCVALSFVRGAGDLRLLRQKMAAAGGAVPVVAKIEKPEAVEHLSEILDECDGAMIARGDLGVEMSPEDVPIVQKRIIRECRNRGIFVITATQMLESMLHSPLPTRAEASDVANAIFDGTDAVMLSGETAVGEYPIQSVEMMARIGVRAENESLDRAASFSGVQDRCPFLGVAPMMGEGASSVTEAAADAACAAAHALGARLIAAFTMTGSTAAMLSRRRPKTPIVAFSPVGATSRSMCFRHGVQPLEAPIFESTDEMIERAEAVLLERGLVSSGDTIVCVAGASTGTPGGTNLVKLHKLP